MRKKICAWLLALVFACLGFSGCKKTDGPGDTGGVVPDMDLSQKLTISWMIPTQQGLSLTETPMFQAIQEKLNIEIELTEMPVSQFEEKKKLNITAKEIPDIMSWTKGAEANEYGPLGAFLELSQYFEYTPNIKEKIESAIADSENVRYAVYNAENKIYMMPHYLVNPIPIFDFSYVKSAFDEVGVTSLNTWDQVYEGLKKIKEANPSEYPLAFRNHAGMQVPLRLFVESFTGARATTLDYTGYDYDTNQFQFALDVPGYKEAVAFFAKLYTEGLIHPDYTIMDEQMLKTRISRGKIVMIADFIGGWSGVPSIMKDIDNNLLPLPTPQASGQDVVIGREIPVFDSSVGTIINQNVAKDPVKLGRCLQFLDYIYSQEFYDLQWHHPDVTVKNDDGTYTYKPEVYDLEGDYNRMKDTYFPWAMTANFQDAMEERPTIGSPYYEYRETYLRGEESKDKYKPFPIVPLSLEEQQAVNQAVASITDRFNASISQFAEGKRSMDEWEEFSNSLKQAGGNELISIYNEALKRLNK